MGKVVMNASVSVDGFIAAENDDPGPLFEWLVSGDVPLDDSGVLNVSQASYDHIRPYWDQIGVTIAGRHVFDITDGWDGTPPSGIDHVVVVTHRPAPEGWDRNSQFHFVHEFREFTGLTPTRYVEVRQRFLREHPGHALEGWPLPAD